MSISKKIAKLRKELKMTKEEFGQKIGITERMVARWENKTSNPTQEQLDKIKEVFNVDLKEETEKKEVKKEVKKEEVKVSLNKEDRKNLKALSKVIYVFAKIIKVLLIICIPFLVALMIIIPVIVKHIEIGDNYLKYTTSSGEVFSIESESLSLNGTYKIQFNGDTETREIRYDLLGEIAKNINKMTNTKIIVFSETMVVLGIAIIILSVVFFTYLNRLFKNIYERTPFTEENINYLRKMMYVLIINIIMTFLLEFVSGIFFNTDVSFDSSLNSVIVMMVIASLSYIFKYGYNLQQRVESDIY